MDVREEEVEEMEGSEGDGVVEDEEGGREVDSKETWEKEGGEVGARRKGDEGEGAFGDGQRRGRECRNE
ncbi:hypothetical protein CJ030_MR5G017229 [Morella rubra]|uniref:Uncharacterized protein n=1 Tax=Morella rubra TaxID=262757 RepID=A0A6A1VPU0_9ROSI|nr:hypothetical protein CJ030_MR5G017229 [Morella rubra]